MPDLKSWGSQMLPSKAPAPIPPALPSRLWLCPGVFVCWGVACPPSSPAQGSSSKAWHRLSFLQNIHNNNINNNIVDVVGPGAAGGEASCPHLSPQAPTDGAGLSCPLPVPPRHESWFSPPKALTLSNHQCPSPPCPLGLHFQISGGDVAWYGQGDPLSAGLCL